jgi:hypothetical protein
MYEQRDRVELGNLLQGLVNNRQSLALLFPYTLFEMITPFDHCTHIAALLEIRR